MKSYIKSWKKWAPITLLLTFTILTGQNCQQSKLPFSLGALGSSSASRGLASLGAAPVNSSGAVLGVNQNGYPFPAEENFYSDSSCTGSPTTNCVPTTVAVTNHVQVYGSGLSPYAAQNLGVSLVCGSQTVTVVPSSVQIQGDVELDFDATGGYGECLVTLTAGGHTVAQATIGLLGEPTIYSIQNNGNGNFVLTGRFPAGLSTLVGGACSSSGAPGNNLQVTPISTTQIKVTGPLTQPLTICTFFPSDPDLMESDGTAYADNGNVYQIDISSQAPSLSGYEAGTAGGISYVTLEGQYWTLSASDTFSYNSPDCTIVPNAQYFYSGPDGDVPNDSTWRQLNLGVTKSGASSNFSCTFNIVRISETASATKSYVVNNIPLPPPAASPLPVIGGFINSQCVVGGVACPASNPTCEKAGQSFACSTAVPVQNVTYCTYPSIPGQLTPDSSGHININWSAPNYPNPLTYYQGTATLTCYGSGGSNSRVFSAVCTTADGNTGTCTYQ